MKPHDAAMTVAILAVLMAICSVTIAVLAFIHSHTVRKAHDRLFKEFWRQAHQQAASHHEIWKQIIATNNIQAERMREVASLFNGPLNRLKKKPLRH